MRNQTGQVWDVLTSYNVLSETTIRSTIPSNPKKGSTYTETITYQLDEAQMTYYYGYQVSDPEGGRTGLIDSVYVAPDGIMNREWVNVKTFTWVEE